MINVCIVDDEKNIREGIQYLIDWDSLGCTITGLCATGAQALDFIRNNPLDIVVTDIKMPVMDGLELSRHIKEEQEHVKVIILTAYSEFSMARQALRNGVCDFIVKNEFMDELPKAIEKNVAEILKERESKGSDTESKIKEITFESLLTELVQNPNKEINPDLVKAATHNNKNFCVCACEIDYYGETGGDERNPVDMFSNLLKIALKNCDYFLCQASNRLLFLGISYEAGHLMDINRVVGYLSNMLIMVEEFMRVQIKIGLSLEHADFTQLKVAFTQSRDALAKIDSKGCLLKIYEETLHSKSGELLDVDKYMEKICDLTFDENREDALDELNAFVGDLRESDCGFDQCKLYILVVYSTLIHKAVRYQLSVELDFNQLEMETYRAVGAANTLEDLGKIGEGIIKNLREICVGKRNFKNELVTKVEECIKEKYMEELTLQVISNEIFLNASYVSRAYKKMTGKTVTEAITLYRVNKAKDMLKATTLRIYEIAEKVGFKDAAYFTNVFVKFENMSPSDFRQTK